MANYSGTGNGSQEILTPAARVFHPQEEKKRLPSSHLFVLMHVADGIIYLPYNIMQSYCSASWTLRVQNAPNENGSERIADHELRLTSI